MSDRDLPKGWSIPDQEHVQIGEITCLSDNWYRLYRVGFDLKRSDGSWQHQTREAYERGNGAGILLYNRANRGPDTAVSSAKLCEWQCGRHVDRSSGRVA